MLTDKLAQTLKSNKDYTNPFEVKRSKTIYKTGGTPRNSYEVEEGGEVRRMSTIKEKVTGEQMVDKEEPCKKKQNAAKLNDPIGQSLSIRIQRGSV